MSPKIPKRITWAVDILDVQPSDNILEIGCGYGHAINPICSMLADGNLTCIDRSAKMTDAAARSNKQELDSGKVTILNKDLLYSGLPTNRFDKIFLFNINVFWMDPIEELTAVRGLLKENGTFFIFHQPPPGMKAGEYAERFQHNLLTNGFDVVETIYESFDDVEMTAVISRPSPR